MSDLSPQAQRLLQRTREALSPDESAVATLRAALDARLGSADVPYPDAEQTPGAREPATAAKASLLKLVVSALIAGVYGAVVFGLRAPHAAQAPAAGQVPPPMAAAPTARPESALSIMQNAVPTAPSLQSVPPSAAAGRSARRTRAVQRHVHDSSRTTDVTQPGPAHEAVSEPQPRAADDDSLGPELALLREARAALDRHDPSAALALLDQHAQRYPAGTLQQERLAARALALCALGRAEAASASARELAHVAPGSPYLARVRAGCNTEQSK